MGKGVNRVTSPAMKQKEGRGGRFGACCMGERHSSNKSARSMEDKGPACGTWIRSSRGFHQESALINRRRRGTGRSPASPGVVWCMSWRARAQDGLDGAA